MADLRSEILGALARGYCTKENEKKVMDSELCKAQAHEIEALIDERYVEREVWDMTKYPPRPTDLITRQEAYEICRKTLIGGDWLALRTAFGIPEKGEK